MHDYLQHQRSRAEVLKLSEKRRKAGEQGGRAKAKAVASGTADARGFPQLATASKRSKTLAEAEAEAEELPGVHAGRSSSGGNLRTRDTDDDKIIDRIRTRTGHVISPGEIPALRQLVLAGHKVANPLAYILKVIDDEPDPARRFLNGAVSEAGRHTSAVPFSDLCRVCGKAGHDIRECPA